MKRYGRVPAILLLAMAGCSLDSGSDTASLPDVDYAFFVKKVQPIFEARCGFFACHGSRQRSLQIYQEARLREIPDPDPIFEAPAPLTESELQRNFRNAAGMLYGFEDPEESLLFSKPLQSGTRHGGATLFGGPDVFLDRQDPDYQTLLAWARGARLPAEEEAAGPQSGAKGALPCPEPHNRREAVDRQSPGARERPGAILAGAPGRTRSASRTPGRP